MKKGDLVTVDFPFTDLTGRKKRPALVLAFDSVDVTLAFVTTQLFQARSPDLVLQPSAGNGLKLPSVIRTSKFATLKQTLIHGKLGELTPAELVALDAGLVQSLDINIPAKS